MTRVLTWLTDRLTNVVVLWVPFVGWKIKDVVTGWGKPAPFNEFGVTVYAGRQGEGKTISMVHYLKRMRLAYPRVMVVTNFDCAYATHSMDDWDAFFTLRNGMDGVIFAIDEIQTDWSSLESRNFPPEILTELTQQRKQRVKIVTTSQVFGRMAKPLREQTYDVIECRTYFGRLTVQKCYDAFEYENRLAHGLEEVKAQKRLWWTAIVQTDELRASYDTDKKVQGLRKRQWRGRE